MKPTAFVDTASWLALLNVRDGLHPQAVTVQNTLQRQKTALVTTEFVLIEAADAFSAPPLRALAVTFINRLRLTEAVDAVEIVPVSEELLQRGWTLYQ